VSRPRFTIIEFPVFCHYIVHVEVTPDFKKSLAQYPQTRDVDPDPDTAGLTVHVKNETLSFVFIHANCPVSTIAHESWHVVERMLGYVGVDLDSETVAYHLGFLVDKVFKFVRKRK